MKSLLWFIAGYAVAVQVQKYVERTNAVRTPFSITPAVPLPSSQVATR